MTQYSGLYDIIISKALFAKVLVSLGKGSVTGVGFVYFVVGGMNCYYFIKMVLRRNECEHCDRFIDSMIGLPFSL